MEASLGGDALRTPDAGRGFDQLWLEPDEIGYNVVANLICSVPSLSTPEAGAHQYNPFNFEFGGFLRPIGEGELYDQEQDLGAEPQFIRTVSPTERPPTPRVSLRGAARSIAAFTGLAKSARKRQDIPEEIYTCLLGEIRRRSSSSSMSAYLASMRSSSHASNLSLGPPSSLGGSSSLFKGPSSQSLVPSQPPSSRPPSSRLPSTASLEAAGSNRSLLSKDSARSLLINTTDLGSLEQPPIDDLLGSSHSGYDVPDISLMMIPSKRVLDSLGVSVSLNSHGGGWERTASAEEEQRTSKQRTESGGSNWDTLRRATKTAIAFRLVAKRETGLSAEEEAAQEAALLQHVDEFRTSTDAYLQSWESYMHQNPEGLCIEDAQTPQTPTPQTPTAQAPTAQAPVVQASTLLGADGGLQAAGGAAPFSQPSSAPPPHAPALDALHGGMLTPADVYSSIPRALPVPSALPVAPVPYAHSLAQGVVIGETHVQRTSFDVKAISSGSCMFFPGAFRDMQSHLINLKAFAQNVACPWPPDEAFGEDMYRISDIKLVSTVSKVKLQVQVVPPGCWNRRKDLININLWSSGKTITKGCKDRVQLQLSNQCLALAVKQVAALLGEDGKPVVRAPLDNITEEVRLTSSNLLGNWDLNLSCVRGMLDLQKLSEYLDPDTFQQVQEVKLPKPKGNSAHFCNLSLYIKKEALTRWPTGDNDEDGADHKLTTCYVNVYESGKCSVLAVPSIEVAEELADVVSSLLYGAFQQPGIGIQQTQGKRRNH